MIVKIEVEVSIGSTNLKYYRDLGYDCKNRSKLIIKVEHLQRGTGIKINVKCDICGKESKIYVQKYFMNMDNMNIYTCRICSDVKRKITNNKKYGVDNASQSNIIKDKKIKTTMKNWGVENPSQSTAIKDKKAETTLKNYGVEYSFQSEEVRNKGKNTKLEKYGDENYHNIEKSKITNLEKYGCENVSQNDNIKKKKRDTSLMNYGVEYPVILDEVKNKAKMTNLKKYGVEYIMQNRELFIKAKLSSNKIHKYNNTDLYYQGTYEKNFLDIYFNKLKISNINKISYEHNEQIKFYHPDFYLPDFNLIVEIKSDYTYNKELDKNLSKQKSCLEQGYNFIFIIDKEYDEFDKIISTYNI